MKQRIMALIGVTFIALAVWLLLYRGIDVVITNNSAETLVDLRLVCTGDSVAVSKIAPRECQRYRISPKGESNLRVSFVDREGNRHQCPVDDYFESGHSGEINVIITPELQLQTTEKLKLY